MKRGTKLLLLVGVLVLLSLLIWLLPKLETSGKSTAEPVETAAVSTELTVDKATVTGIGWNYRGAELSFTRGETWLYPADESFPVNGETLNTLLDAVTAIPTLKTIADPEALSAYGLEEPELTVTLTMATGERALSFGNLSGTGEECYFQNGDGRVYLVDPTLKERFYLSLLDVIQPEELPELIGADELTVVTAEGELRLHCTGGSWYAGETLLDAERTETFLDTVRSFSWLACVCYGADALDLQVYGLDEPAGTVTLAENGKTLLALEITEDGYGRLAGSGMLYSVSTETCRTLLYTTKAELLPDEVLSADWDSVEALDFTLNGETYTAQRQEDAQSWEICGLTTDLAALRDTLDEMTGSYAYGAQPERKLRLQIVVKTRSGGAKTLCFYPYDSGAYLVQQDGDSTVFITRSQMEELLSAILVLVS